MLYTENLILRKAQENDLYDIFNNIWSDKNIYENMFFKPTTNIEEALERLNRTIEYQNNNYTYFICYNNEVIGFTGITYKKPQIYEETGICIASKYQGNGFGNEVLTLLKKLIFEELNGKVFLYYFINSNIKSKRLCLKEGFKYLESKKIIREWDNKELNTDCYYFTRKMYKAEKGCE